MADTSPGVDLVAPYTNRLRCPKCHRYIGVQGADEVPCPRCSISYRKTPTGLYLVKEASLL